MATEQLGDRTLFTTTDLAVELNWHRETVVKRLDGCEPDKLAGTEKKRVKKYYMSTVVKHLLESNGRNIDNAEAQTKLNKAREEQITLKNNRDKGLLVERATVFSEVKSMIHTVKSRLLAMPSAVSGRLCDLDDEDEVSELLKSELYVILSEMSASQWKE